MKNGIAVSVFLVCLLPFMSPLALAQGAAAIQAAQPTVAEQSPSQNASVKPATTPPAPDSAPHVEKPAALDFSPASLAFSPLEVGQTSVPQTLTIKNNSKDTLTVTGVESTDAFAVEDFSPPKKLGPGETLSLSVRFKPTQDHTYLGMLAVNSDSVNSPRSVCLFGSVADPQNDLCGVPANKELLLTFFLCLFYWVAMVIVRWNRIARPTREFLKAQIDCLRAEMETLAGAGEPTDTVRVEKIAQLLSTAKGLVDNPSLPRLTRIANVLFWSRGQELTGWEYVYQAEIQMVPLLGPQTVMARLESNEQQLRMTNDTPSLSLANAIHTQLTAAPADVDISRRAALLEEALNANHERDEANFSDLVSWQNKASWLVGCGLVLILVSTASIHHHAILFIVGATGGLISRLSRSLDRKDVPTDYGASWTTLFLSPVAGALGAWAGILLCQLAVNLKVLGSVFDVSWSESPCKPITLAIALLFGFSERLLDGVFDQLIAKTQESKSSSGAAAPAQQSAANQPASPTKPPEQKSGNG